MQFFTINLILQNHDYPWHDPKSPREMQNKVPQTAHKAQVLPRNLTKVTLLISDIHFSMQVLVTFIIGKPDTSVPEKSKGEHFQFTNQ